MNRTGRDVIMEIIEEFDDESLSMLLSEGLSCEYCPIGISECSGRSAYCDEQLKEYLESEVT